MPNSKQERINQNIARARQSRAEPTNGGGTGKATNGDEKPENDSEKKSEQLAGEIEGNKEQLEKKIVEEDKEAE